MSDPFDTLFSALSLLIAVVPYLFWLGLPSLLIVLGLVLFLTLRKPQPPRLDGFHKLFARAGVPADEAAIERELANAKSMAPMGLWFVFGGVALLLLTAPVFFFVSPQLATAITLFSTFAGLFAMTARLAVRSTRRPSSDLQPRPAARASDFVMPWAGWLLAAHAIVGGAGLAIRLASTTNQNSLFETWSGAGADVYGGLRELMFGLGTGSSALAIAVAVAYPLVIRQLARLPRTASTDLEQAQDDVLRENRMLALAMMAPTLGMLGLVGAANLVTSAAISTGDNPWLALALTFGMLVVLVVLLAADIAFFAALTVAQLTGRPPRVMRTLWKTLPRTEVAR